MEIVTDGEKLLAVLWIPQGTTAVQKRAASFLANMEERRMKEEKEGGRRKRAKCGKCTWERDCLDDDSTTWNDISGTGLGYREHYILEIMESYWLLFCMTSSIKKMQRGEWGKIVIRKVW